MQHVLTFLGWVLAICAALLALLGIAAWPPGGLMFALPYVFLSLAVLAGLAAWLLVWLGRRLSARRRAAPPLSPAATPRE
jgi:hypothetical protein